MVGRGVCWRNSVFSVISMVLGNFSQYFPVCQRKWTRDRVLTLTGLLFLLIVVCLHSLRNITIFPRTWIGNIRGQIIC